MLVGPSIAQVMSFNLLTIDLLSHIFPLSRNQSVCERVKVITLGNKIKFPGSVGTNTLYCWPGGLTWSWVQSNSWMNRQKL